MAKISLTMHTVTVISVLLLMCTVTHEYGFDDYTYGCHRERREVATFKPLNDSCTKQNFSKKVKTTFLRGVCDQPRPLVVPIAPDDPSTEFVPSHVEVNRCHGMCHRNQKCSPSKIAIKEIPVGLKKVDGVEDCGLALVEEHISCKCDCSFKDHHCNRMQEFNSSECKCICKNKDMKVKCHNMGRFWNPKTCRCECPHGDMECSSGMEWVPSICKCMFVYDKVKCSGEKFYRRTQFDKFENE